MAKIADPSLQHLSCSPTTLSPSAPSHQLSMPKLKSMGVRCSRGLSTRTALFTPDIVSTIRGHCWIDFYPS